MILLFPRGSELPGKQSEKSFRAEKGYVRRHETVEKDHGRFETRRTVVSTELGWLAQKDEWAGLQAEAMVESSREIGGKISCERRYDLFSMTDVTRIALSIRQHWAIENQQHWILGVQFVEDARRTRKTIPPPSWPDSPGSPQFAATGYFQQGQHPASQDAFALRFKLPRNPALQTAPLLRLHSAIALVARCLRSFVPMFGIWHASGTFKMGDVSDVMAVTDNAGRVRGVQGLRLSMRH